MTNFIQTHRWIPDSNPVSAKGCIYLLHGTGEHAARYAPLASRLTSLGWVVGAHDHPGHGLSEGKRGLISPAGSLATQAAIQIQAFANETGTTPIVFGHSLGGVLATELVLHHGLKVAGLILSAPAYVPITSVLDRLKIRLLTWLAPELCLDLGYDASRLTHDETIKGLAHADPLIHGYKSATLINWLIRSGSRCVADAQKLHVPTLLLIAGADLIIDSDKTQEFADRVTSKEITVRNYEDSFHELLNETPERREAVLTDIEAWLATQY